MHAAEPGPSSPAPAPAPVAPETTSGAERQRLAESAAASSPWRLWGPYLSGRQWGTVREDYSADGDAWSSFPFDQACGRAYRWGEDGLGGICDRFGFLNFSVALWNHRDPILKERLFGLTNGEGNHGEDAKEYWWAIDGTPTHSWMQWLYRYPQAEYPYSRLREENMRRGRDQREYELADTGVLDQDRFFDVQVTYAKAGPDDVCITITATNHGPQEAPLDILPQVWLRNTWAWGRDRRRGSLHQMLPPTLTVAGLEAVECDHGFLGRYYLAAEGSPEVLFCDNETNAVRLFGAAANASRYTKDGINDRVVRGDAERRQPGAGGHQGRLLVPVPEHSGGRERGQAEAPADVPARRKSTISANRSARPPPIGWPRPTSSTPA